MSVVNPRPRNAAEANRLFYAENASTYASSEHCVKDPAAQELLDEVLALAIDASPSCQPKTLDACGGTGNVSDNLASRGISTTLVDVSPAMLEHWRTRAQSVGIDTETVESDIDNFLISDDREWDLIVFSSALHHLDDYVAVVRSAGSSLAPGGVFVSVFDPTIANGSITRLLRWLDYAVNLAVTEPDEFMRGITRRFGRAREGGVNIGAMAEKHAIDGVDDNLVVATLGDLGFEIVEHRRYSHTRLRLTRALFQILKRPTTFHLIARRPEQPTTQTPST